MAISSSDMISYVRAFIPNGGDMFTDEQLSIYLDFARVEILGWIYSLIPKPDGVDGVPDKYMTVQCMSVVVGLGLLGGTNEVQHDENGIARVFKYSDMVDYIRAHVTPYARVG